MHKKLELLGYRFVTYIRSITLQESHSGKFFKVTITKNFIKL